MLNSATPVAFVNVTDRARGVAFYRDTLGLTHNSADEFGDFFGVGSALMRLTALPDHRATGHPILGWDVTDIAATAAWLKQNGVTLTVYDGMGQDADGIWTAPDGVIKVAWFADPDGNVLSLSQTQ